MSSPGDQHPVGDLGPGCAHPALGVSVRCWAARRDLHHLDPSTRQHRIERLGELPGPVPDQEPKPAGAVPRSISRLRTARQVIVCRLGMTGGDFAAELDGWLAVRDPADAVEALLAAAPGPEDVGYRRTAVQIASGIDGDTEHAWRSALSIPAIRPYVIVELNRRAGRDFQRDPLPGLEPLDCDAVVLASETIMGAYALSIRNSQAIADAVSAAGHPGQEPVGLDYSIWLGAAFRVGIIAE